MFACFAHGEQQTNEPESQIPTQISVPFPHCVGLYSLLKSHLEIGVETKLWLVSVFVEQRGCTCLPPFQLKRCPQPLGKWYNEDLYAYTLPHFNCKRYTHPALWTSDGCIMGRAQNMTVHHVHTTCHFTFHCCLMQFIAHRWFFYGLQCFENVWNVLIGLLLVMKPPNVVHNALNNCWIADRLVLLVKINKS